MQEYVNDSMLIKSVCFVVSVIVKASSGPRYVVGCRSKVDKEKLTSGTRVVLDMTTLTIMRALPREVSYQILFFLFFLFDERVCVLLGYLFFLLF